MTKYNSTHEYINISIQTDRSDNNHTTTIKKPTEKLKIYTKQLILLYLKFQSNIINFESFSSQYRIMYDSYKSNVKTLEKHQIIKEVNKSNSSKFKTYRLIKQNVEIFPYASQSDEELFFKYLHSPITTKVTAAESNSYIHIILNPNALQMLKQIKKKYKSKPFKKSSIVGSSTTKARAFKFLKDNNAIRKTAPQTYILAEFYHQALQQAKLKKNPPIFNSADLNSIIKDTKWSKFCNVHNLEISTSYFEGLFEDLFYLKKYNHKFNPLSNDNKKEGIKFLEKEKIHQTRVTVIIYPKTTIITIKCSENPIYQNKLLRLNKILAEIIGIINKDPHVTKKYDYDYHNFTIVRHDKALDGTLPFRLKKGLQLRYKNTDGQDLFLYVKKNYKSSNSSWVRSEIRSDATTYSVYDFRKMILNSKLNIYPC